MLAERNTHIGRAVAVLKELSEDERTRLLEESCQKARWDEELRIEAALAEGRMEGRMEGALATARNALRMGLSAEDVAIMTGVSREEVERLRAEND